MGGIVAAIRGPRVNVDPLSEQQLVKLREEFNIFDEHERGYLTLKQFQRLLERRINTCRTAVQDEGEPSPLQQQQRPPAGEPDTARSSERTPTVFARITSNQHKQDRTLALQEAERAFAAADKDNNKQLTFEEFVDWNRELLKSANDKRKPGWLDDDM